MFEISDGLGVDYCDTANPFARHFQHFGPGQPVTPKTSAFHGHRRTSVSSKIVMMKMSVSEFLQPTITPDVVFPERPLGQNTRSNPSFAITISSSSRSRKILVGVVVLARIFLAHLRADASTRWSASRFVACLDILTSLLSREATRSIGRRKRKKKTERMAKPLAARACRKRASVLVHSVCHELIRC
jgi:hypothetical protein